MVLEKKCSTSRTRVKPEVKPETKPGEGELVKTGDMTPILSLIGLSGASLGVATVMFRKRRAK